MKKKLAVAFLFLSVSKCFSQPAPVPTVYDAQAYSIELSNAINGKVQALSALLASQEQIKKLTSENSALKTENENLKQVHSNTKQ